MRSLQYLILSCLLLGDLSFSATTFNGLNQFSTLNSTVLSAGITAIRSKKISRSYERGFTRKEQETITWIVNTLAWDSLASIWGKEDKLKKEGKTLDSMHPLRFCEVIMTDEKLKSGMKAISKRTGLVKKDFFGGITKSLAEESAANNLKVEYVQDFANRTHTDFNQLNSLLRQKKWTGFVDYLIETIPNNENTRYNM